ncbi:MAG TPA: hypothetical protein VF018_13605 [Acidobacteriaceae bacterium]
MRVNVTAHPSLSPHAAAPRPVILTIQPSCGIPGDFSYTTDSASLMRMLRQKTELRLSVIENFQRELEISKSARLLSVEMSERTLTEIGYFID